MVSWNSADICMVCSADTTVPLQVLMPQRHKSSLKNQAPAVHYSSKYTSTFSHPLFFFFPRVIDFTTRKQLSYSVGMEKGCESTCLEQPAQRQWHTVKNTEHWNDRAGTLHKGARNVINHNRDEPMAPRPHRRIFIAPYFIASFVTLLSPTSCSFPCLCLPIHCHLHRNSQSLLPVFSGHWLLIPSSSYITPTQKMEGFLYCA